MTRNTRGMTEDDQNFYEAWDARLLASYREGQATQDPGL